VSDGAAIEAALSEVSKGLQAGDLAAAESSVGKLVALCQAAAGTQLTADQIDRMTRMLESCNQLAAATRGRLTESLLQFGNGSRAQRAYGDR
jgi:hypothetical protein